MRDQKLKFLVVDALFAVIIALLAQVAIPLGPIPLTGQTFAIGLAATILGARHGTISVLVYIVLGAVGIPVFQGMTAGIGILFGADFEFYQMFVSIGLVGLGLMLLFVANALTQLTSKVTMAIIQWHKYAVKGGGKNA